MLNMKIVHRAEWLSLIYVVDSKLRFEDVRTQTGAMTRTVIEAEPCAFHSRGRVTSLRPVKMVLEQRA